MTAFTELDYSSMTIQEINDSYGMFSKEGGKEVAELVQAMLKLPIITSNDELYAQLKHGMKSIAKIGHREVYDTEVRECIINKIERETKRELSIFEI